MASEKSGLLAERIVEPKNIESALRNLWKSEGADSGEAVFRASTFTLVALSVGDAEIMDVQRSVERTSRSRPCRAIIVSVDPEGREAKPLASILAATSRTGQGRKQVSLELVMLAVSPPALPTIPNLVNSLVVPDVPVVVYAKSDVLLDTELMARLHASADRVIFDSRSFRDPGRSIRTLLALVATRKDPVVLCDLAWARLAPWRDVLGQVFDQPEAAALVRRIAEVRVDVAMGGDPARRSVASGALLLGWMAAALGVAMEQRAWPTGDGGMVLRGRQNEREVQLVLGRKETPTIAPGRLASVRIRTDAANGQGVVEISRLEDRNAVSVKVATPEVCKLPSTFSFPEFKGFDLLGAEIAAARDPNLKAAMNTAVPFL